MRPSFQPRLINGPFDDPGLFIPFVFQNRAVIFDLGDIAPLSARDILKISHAFVSHTHMDHFIGFDRLLRLSLGRDKSLALYGPPGFLKNVEGKLAAYAWNLADKYDYPLILTINEVHPGHTLNRQYRCRDSFQPLREPVERPFNGVLYSEPAFEISAAILDHKISCLGFSLKERFHVNILNSGLAELGLRPGPWLTEFKQALYDRKDPGSAFNVDQGRDAPSKNFALGELAAKIAIISPGQKISYVTDVMDCPANRQRIVELAAEADHLFIEAAFLDRDREIAARKHHLTARRAGCWAGEARAKQLTVFHFSPRYMDEGPLLHAEAAQAYASALKPPAAGSEIP